MSDQDDSILLTSQSPICPLAVFVEEGDVATYMYLLDMKKAESGKDNPVITSAWVRNHVESTSFDLDLDSSRQGLAPLMPKGSICSLDTSRMDPSALECVWFEDGRGVALLEKGDIVCIMPPWVDDTHPPYARDCVKPNDFLVPLAPDDPLITTVQKAQGFKAFILADSELEAFGNGRLDLLEDRLGECQKSYAFERDLPTINRVFQFEQGDVVYLITATMSLHMQPGLGLKVNAPENFRRVEIGFALDRAYFETYESEIVGLMTYFAVYPWHECAWFVHDDTIQCFEGFSKKELFPFGVFVHGKEIGGLFDIPFPDFRGDPVNVLWLVPISRETFLLIRDMGAHAFFSKYQGFSVIFRP
ncbi:MAG: suppressor of fused domain protein [Alphaproteobacteria bacterium]